MTAQKFLAQLKHPVRLPQAALTYAKVIAYPDMDVTPYLDRINNLYKVAKSIIPEDLSDQEKAIALSKMLFGPGGLRGNSADYYDPRNSFINDVLDRKLGIPITLTAVLIEVGSKLGLNIKGVGLPGHFIAALAHDEGVLYLDPFHNGRELTIDDCKKLVKQMGGMEMKFNPDWLRPVSRVEILVRMLSNLKLIYIQNKQWEKVLHVLKLLKITQPNEPDHVRDIGLINFKRGNNRKAIYHLEAYVLRKFRADDASPIRALLDDLVKKEACAN